MKTTDQKPKGWQRALLASLLLFSFFLGSSCVGPDAQEVTYTQPHTQSYDPNPPREAIVGMWQEEVAGVPAGAKVTCTLFFKSNGTGFSRVYGRNYSPGERLMNNKNFPLTWKYEGRGAWSVVQDVSSIKNIKNRKKVFTYKFRVTPKVGASGDRLLYAVSDVGRSKYVPVR